MSSLGAKSLRAQVSMVRLLMVSELDGFRALKMISEGRISSVLELHM